MGNDKKILITGTTGFIGLPLSSHLNNLGWQVVALNRTLSDRAWEESHQFELAAPDLDPAIFSDVQAVVHLAGIAHTSGYTAAEYAQINTRASISLAVQALAAGVERYVYISSSRVQPGVEGDVVNDNYAISKADAELGLRKLCRDQGLQLTIARPSLVYGAGAKGNLVRLLRAIKGRWLPLLPETSGGTSMIAVNDVTRAIQVILENDITINKTYGLDDGETYNPRRIQLETLEALGKNRPAWTISMKQLDWLAGLGDLSESIGVRPPLTRKTLGKLFADNAYHDATLSEEANWHPANRLKELLPEMLELI